MGREVSGVIPERYWGRRHGGVPGCAAPVASAGHLLQVKRTYVGKAKPELKDSDFLLLHGASGALA